MSRLAVMAHYDPRGDVGPHVRRQVGALAEAFDDLLIVSTAELTDDSRAWLGRHGRVVPRANYGYDFFSYKTGLDMMPLERYDAVVICNDTYVGPLVGYDAILDRMESRPCDFWGLTASQRISPHVQSFFVCFRPWLVGSQAFRDFWGEMRPVSDRTRVIRSYEVGMSTAFTDAGFSWASYYVENEADRALARRRVHWWTYRRLGVPRDDVEREIFSKEWNGWWNPSTALSDVALDGGRLPFVKIDTLRHDPYGLNSPKLLSLGETHAPDAFDGVRAYLDSTAPLYPKRPQDVLRPIPAALQPVRHLVEYGRAL